ncbi:hypothetical protein FPANT_10593 [Fusarium pseudoanthophilum]|uniref:Uncharacterized protein n=1 Tax=Fusarium pseudoanthophilum TaxID=48495 RepID=A0A8H5NSF0_9HYPO|nr:hypothetical protein FPANT_10593 [Fusarium pseudoanthophilum]
MQSQDSPASFGVLGAEPPVLSTASSPYSIIFEWAALLPLVIYLSSSRLPHRLVGQTALSGYVPVALFPRLGVIATVADFLQQGQEFLDRASSGNDLRRKVWDVNWGSIFPCANGAVAAMLSAHALRNVNVQKVPEEVEQIPGPKEGFKPLKSSSPFRRYQKLHILRFTETTKKMSHARCLWSSLLSIFEVLLPLGLLGVSVVCFLCGLYGTGIAIVLAVLLRISRHLIVVGRPDGYLKNNEAGLPGCMLVALNENASTWYLYIGSRGVIDTMFNKTMVQSVHSPLGIWHAYALRALEALQILVMTYVAAQKGWDGVALLSLVVVSSMLDYIIYSDDRLASQWLKREGVKVNATTLQFSGRTPMIGTIQTLGNQRSTTWMDVIIAPSTRRDAWLRRLSSDGKENAFEKDVSLDDEDWIYLNERLTLAARDMIPPDIKAESSA